MDDPWLTDEQQAVWRSWLALGSRLPATLHRQLAADSGLSLPDFDVLVHLSEADGARLRVSDLARVLGWERSRLSHQVTRMLARGLVGREDCPDDARGAFVVLSAAGRAALEKAAPGHARTVRDLVFADLGEREVAELGKVLAGVLARLER